MAADARALAAITVRRPDGSEVRLGDAVPALADEGSDTVVILHLLRRLG